MKLKIEFDVDNDWFQIGENCINLNAVAGTVQRIANKIRDIESLEFSDSFVIMDGNGNKVGTCSLED